MWGVPKIRGTLLGFLVIRIFSAGSLGLGCIGLHPWGLGHVGPELSSYDA